MITRDGWLPVCTSVTVRISARSLATARAWWEVVAWDASSKRPADVMGGEAKIDDLAVVRVRAQYDGAPFRYASARAAYLLSERGGNG